MHTVVETAEFQKQARAVWNDSEREAFIDWIAANPDAGDVIPGATKHAKYAGAVLGWASAAA